MFNEFFELSPVDYAKYLINLKKNTDETLEIIKEILDYSKNAQRFLSLASEVDKKIRTKD